MFACILLICVSGICLLICWVDCGGLVVGRFVDVVVFGCALVVCFVWRLFVIYLLIVLLPIH